MRSDREPAAATSAAPTLGQVLEVMRPQVEKIEEGFKAIRITLDALAECFGSVPPRGEPPAQAPAAVPEPPLPAEPPRAAVPRAAAAEPARPAPAAAPVPQERAPAAATPAPPARPGIPVNAAAAAGGNWSQIIFGEQLGADPSISYLSGSLLSEVYAGDQDALGMIGQLLCFRAANAERKPKYLKDVGEAFYRWKPRGEPPLRDSLIAWVHALLTADGLNNRIDIVQIGDRYDMQRHNAAERGVEVADVFGWVVLRDNGKVYSKANVSLR
jgi:hypothetical protein